MSTIYRIDEREPQFPCWIFVPANELYGETEGKWFYRERPFGRNEAVVATHWSPTAPTEQPSDNLPPSQSSGPGLPGSPTDASDRARAGVNPAGGPTSTPEAHNVQPWMREHNLNLLCREIARAAEKFSGNYQLTFDAAKTIIARHCASDAEGERLLREAADMLRDLMYTGVGDMDAVSITYDNNIVDSAERRAPELERRIRTHLAQQEKRPATERGEGGQ